MAGDDRTDLADASKRRGLDPAAVARSLARLARAGEAPWLHRQVAERLLEHLDPIRIEPARVIDWWSGPGGIAPLLAKRYPRAEIACVEPCADWLRGPSGGDPRRWWQRFAAAKPPPRHLASDGDASLAPAQLIVANMALHGVADPPQLFERWHRLLGDGGVAAFSCLGPGTLSELRTIYRERGWPAPTPVFIDMHDLGDMMVRAGFADPVLDQETIAVTWPDARALLDELRRLGGNAAPGRFGGWRTPRWRRALEAALTLRADAGGRIALSFEIAYGHGFKTVRRDATVPLESLRQELRRKR